MAAKRDSKSSAGNDIFGSLVAGIFEMLGAGDRIFAKVRHSAEEQVEVFAARMGLRMLFLLWVSAGVFLALLGFFYLLIDLAGVTRGLVFSVGGALISLVSLLLLHFARKGMADFLK